MKNQEKMQLTPDGFIEVFEDQLKLHKTMKAAYEATETFHESLFGSRRYSDYKSFEYQRNKKVKNG